LYLSYDEYTEEADLEANACMCPLIISMSTSYNCSVKRTQEPMTFYK